MKTLRWCCLLFGTALLLSALVGLPRKYNPELSIQYSRDLLLLMGLLVATARFRFAPAVAVVATFGWTLALSYEWIRSVGVTAMSQEPLLYDAYFLVGHLYILMRDLMGSKAATIFGGVFGTLAVVTVLTWWLFRLIQRRATPLPTAALWAAIIALVSMGWAVEHREFAKGQNSLADLVENLGKSVEIRDKIGRVISPKAYADVRKVELKERPSVHIYIVESYGNGIRRRSVRNEYYAMTDGLQSRLRSAGWTAMTGLSEAPVMGGRSWLADATLLSGRLVKYESVYRNLVPHLASIATLPGFFNAQGYTTVLMRPKDTARPGVALVNHFDFARTIFSKDLAYTGRPYGWAEIPDQYALGHLRDEVLAPLGDEPNFVFAHLGSSHIPWDEVPPLVEDWRSFNDYKRHRKGKADEELSERQIKNQLKRFKRKDEIRLRRLKPTADNIDDYLRIITYSMEAVIGHVLDMENPPDMVVVMGDHQPPLYKNNTDFTVPIHILVRDPKLHREFRKHGFRRGMRAPKLADKIRHEGFFSLLVRALARPQGLKMPTYRSRGTSRTQK